MKKTKDRSVPFFFWSSCAALLFMASAVIRERFKDRHELGRFGFQLPDTGAKDSPVIWWSGHFPIKIQFIMTVWPTSSKSWNVGGVCFFKGTPFRQAELTNRWQKNIQTPLLIGIDAEWGLGMRLDSAFTFPKQMTLVQSGMIPWSTGWRFLLQKMQETGYSNELCTRGRYQQQSFKPGNWIPVLRGRQTWCCQERSCLYERITSWRDLCSSQTFPRPWQHRCRFAPDTSGNQTDRGTNWFHELFPFRELIRNGIDGVMVGHLFVPSLDSAKNMHRPYHQ